MLVCSSCGHENPEGARFCNECASPLGIAKGPLGEERKIVSVVFADLVGFTAQAEQLDPEDVRELLSGYHERLRAELERHSGTVEKFIGDAVMAVFGAPVAHDDDAERAVRAALAIRDWSRGQPDVQVRIAVNTGEALVRIDARPAEGEAMVAGDVVNAAARMQAAAPVDGVLVGETTYQASRDAISYREHASVQAKGKTEPVLVWEAVDALARVGVDVAGVRTPLVGRSRELELLRSLLGRLREERTTQLVTIVGVPGIGKSRLVRELFDLVAAESDLFRWRQGRCLPYGDAVSFWALGEIVKAEAGILDSEDPAAAEKKLAAAVGRVVGDVREARWLTGELRALVGLAGGGIGSSTAQPAWRRFVEALAERGPTVLVLEDLHWADDGLLDFVDDLVEWLRDVPLLVVATTRPELLERRSGWGGGKPNATTISLQPLPDDETARLVATLLERPVQLADEQRLLLERAGGNPLFAEQFVRVLRERGSTGELPQSVQGLIAARLDGLPAAEKAVVQEAAVHGRVFWLGGVAATLGCDRSEVETSLRALERKDFVRRERRSAVADDLQYMFQHVLLRDVAYAQIPRKSRADRHRKAAAWLEALGRAEDHAELLAHHYGQALELARAAGVPDPLLVERTRESMRAAGERALALSANEAAEHFLATAISLADASDPVVPRLLLLQARALFALGRPGFDLALQARDAFERAGDVEGRVEAATVAARFAWFSGDRAATDRLIDEALDAVAGRPASRVRVEALASKTGYQMLGGFFDDAVRFGAEALPLAEKLGMDDQRARLQIVVGCAECSSGNAAGFERIRSGIAIAETAGALEMLTLGYGNLGSEYQFFGRLAEARTASERQLALARRYGLVRFVRSAQAEAAGYAYIEGRWDEALAFADELSQATTDGVRSYDDAGLLALRAWMRLVRGDEDGADADSRLAEELARTSDAQAQSMAFTGRALVALVIGASDEAHSLATDLAALGPVVVPALNNPFPNLADVAWVFHDLGRERDLAASILDPSPIESPWIDIARAIIDDDPDEAAEILERIGDHATAAYSRLRASDPAQRALAERFYANVGAPAFATERRRAAGKR